MAALRDTSVPSGTTINQRVIAFFRNRDDAYSAVSDLKQAGFTSDEIGLIRSGDVETGDSPVRQKDLKASTPHEDRSVWDKIKDFFKGEPGDNDYARYHDTANELHWSDEQSGYYYRGISSGGALVSVRADATRQSEARRILEEHGGDLRQSGFPASSRENIGAAQDLESPADQRILLHGEILSIQKDRVQRGEVRVRKEVVTENQNVEVPVTREELVIERNPVQGREAEPGSFESGDKEIRVPLTEEKVRVEKKPVVTEEVKVGKRQVQDNRNVSDSVRHEEVRVEKEGDVADEEVGDIDKKKRRIA